MAFNKVPDDCTVQLDIRCISEETSALIENIKKLLPRGFMLKIIARETAMFTRHSNKYLKILKKVCEKTIKRSIILRGAQGSSDARHFHQINCPGIEFGPIGQGIGSDNEWVDIPSLEKYFQILTSFLLSLT